MVADHYDVRRLRIMAEFVATNMGNVKLRFIMSLVVAFFYAFYVYQALKTGRARKYFGGWVTASESPFSFYSAICISACLAFLALYFAVRSGAILVAR
jgi:hypothetical protein